MPLQFIRNDITKMQVDAIVNAAKNSLLGGGGVDGAIHKAAGPKLLWECMHLGGCPTGKAKITAGYRLPCKHVIHTVGPVWKGGHCGEAEALASCYESSLALALENGCESIAFPLISAGAYGYPPEEALRIATQTITAFLSEHDMLVYIVLFGKDSFALGKALYSDIRSFIDDRYVREHEIRRPDMERDFYGSSRSMKYSEPMMRPSPVCEAMADEEVLCEKSCLLEDGDFSLTDRLSQVDESFSEMLLRKIDEKAMTDAQCYKKANIDRKLFSKIRNNPDYHPTKQTVLAFAIALELSIEETNEMLMKAGFALSHSSKMDIIVEYFIEKKQYDIFAVNEALFAFDQYTLGSC